MRKPIIFSTEMVRATLDGRKTMTRRVINLKKIGIEHKDITSHAYYSEPYFIDEGVALQGHYVITKGWCFKQIQCPFGKIDDGLWVRETWCPYPEEGTGRIYFKATDEKSRNTAKSNSMKPHLYNWRPSIFMPKSACRIFLKITDIRVERVQNISEKDVKAEGYPFGFPDDIASCHTDTELFIGLWDSINEKRGYGWKLNPWVWYISFERVK